MMFVLGLLFSVVGIVVVAAILQGLVLSALWGWFVVPTFGLAPLSIPAAIGLGLILAFTTHQRNLAKEDKKDSAGTVIVNIVLHPLIVLAFGWIVSLFM